MLDILAKIKEVAQEINKVNEKKYESIESGLIALKDVLEVVDKEYVPHFKSLNKGFTLRVGNGRTINYNIGYPSFVYFNGHKINIEVIDNILSSAKENPQNWQEELANHYKDIDLSLVDTNLTKVLLDTLTECENEIKAFNEELALEQELVEE
jgi:hypothetical protein